MWLGRPRATAAVSLDGWGAAMLPINGCVCLAMPAAAAVGGSGGRPSQGLLATRGADVSILVADTLAALELPAQIAPGVIAFAMQEVIDQARPAHFDDWSGFSRAASAITRDNLVDYIAVADRGRAAHAGDARPTIAIRERQMAMPHRLLLVTLAVVAGVALSAQPPPLAVRITSPVDDGYVSGLFRLVAVIEPAPRGAAGQGSRVLRRRPQDLHAHARAIPV